MRAEEKDNFRCARIKRPVPSHVVEDCGSGEDEMTPTTRWPHIGLNGPRPMKARPVRCLPTDKEENVSCKARKSGADDVPVREHMSSDADDVRVSRVRTVHTRSKDHTFSLDPFAKHVHTTSTSNE